MDRIEDSFLNAETDSPLLDWKTDGLGRFTALGPGWVPATGYDPKRLLGRLWTDLGLDPAQLADLLSLTGPRVLFFSIRTQAGIGKSFSVHAAPDSQTKGFRGTAVEVSGAENFTEELRSISETMRASLCSVDARTLTYRYVNQAFARTLGLTMDQIIGRKAEEVLGPEAFARARPILEKAQRGERTDYINLVPIAGVKRWFRIEYIPDRGKDGRVRFINAVIEEVTDQKLAEAAIKKSEDRLRFALETSHIGAWDLDLADHSAYRSDEHARIFGYPDASGPWSYKHFMERVVDEDRERVKSLLKNTIEEKGTMDFQCRIRRPDGEVRRLWVAARYQDPTGGGTAGRVTGIVQDITERIRISEQLAWEKERLGITLTSIGDGVIATDVDGQIELLNPVAEKLTGWSLDKAAGRPLEEVFRIIHEHTRQTCDNPVKRVLETGHTVELENHTVLVSRTGEERIIADSGAPIKDSSGRILGVILVFRDMTEKHKLDEAIRRADKLEALGLLAGGIAHDFNNLLTGILGFVDLAKIQRPGEAQPSASVKYLEKALQVLGRAKALTHQLLTFSKGGHPVRTAVDLGKILKESVVFALSGSKVETVFRIQEGLYSCEADEHQVSQVIDNLVINAVQAMPNGGLLTVEAQNLSVDDHINPALKKGDCILVTIADTGTGIPPQVLPKIFDPFFTTKPRGNGLGLATCHSIMLRHDGWIEAESEVGKGTRFKLYFPRADQAARQPTIQGTHDHRGSGLVLLMDDEEYIRELGRELLTQMGYEVVESRDGSETLEMARKLKAGAQKPVFILLDLTVPGGTGGQEIAGELARLFDQVPLFASSGYADNPVMARPRDFGFLDSLRKPYVRADLTKLLNRHLGTRTQDPAG